MLKIIDNFLPETVFELFVSESKIFSEHIDDIGLSKANPVTSTKDLKNKMGLKWSIFFKQLEDLFPDKELIPQNCRLQSIITDRMGWHTDGALPVVNTSGDSYYWISAEGAVEENSYTAILYTHEFWEKHPDNMGCIEFGSGEIIEPFPNRLALFSRDVSHRVVPGMLNQIRSIAFIGFYHF